MVSDQNNLTLVVLAGGLGTRFGGNKQITPLPLIERTIMELSIEDAFEAGVMRAVLIVNEAVREEIEHTILPRLPKMMEIILVEQHVNLLPSHFMHLAKSRVKPWGTGHALLCAKPFLTGPFIIITADDYYGPGAYKQIVSHFLSAQVQSNLAMVAYPIEKTLSEQGGVNRGICEVKDSKLKSVTEVLNIHQSPTGLVGSVSGQENYIDRHSLTSMTFWGASQTLLAELEKGFEKFLRDYDSDVKMEYYLPDCIQSCIKKELVSVSVYIANEHWFGMTYQEELKKVARNIYEHRQG